jgi:hypothetical protein
MWSELISAPDRKQVRTSLLKHEVPRTGGEALVHRAISISVDVAYVVAPQGQREKVKAGSSISGNQIDDRYS